MTDELPTSEFTGTRTDRMASDRSSIDIATPGYQVQERIGQGAFGAVYRAKRISDGRDFAIKLLKLDNSPDAGTDRNRFFREAVVLCQLQHPRIVSFRELGMAGDTPYIVMDFVPTTSWSEVAANLKINIKIKVAVGVAVHCLEGLAFAHGKGIVHRDIKPSNVLLEKRDKKLTVRLADFGLAKNYFDAGHSGLTDDRQFGGTIGYMAPELIEGYRFFKPASDQYSMAATLFELIAGRPPVKHDPRVNPIVTLRENKFPPIETLVPEVPVDLQKWLHRGLAYLPENRFSSTEEMLACLRQVFSKLR